MSDLAPTFHELSQHLRQRYPSGGSLPELLLLREDSPNAAPTLARLVDASPLLAHRIRIDRTGATSDKRGACSEGRQAIEHAGYRLVHSAAVGCALIDALDAPTWWESHREDWMWMYGQATVASVLAGGLREHRDHAFASTLLRNAGRVLLKHHVPLWAGRALTVSSTRRVSVSVAEHVVLGYTALDLMRDLAMAWNLDQQIFPAFDSKPKPRSVGALSESARHVLISDGFRDPFDPFLTGQPPIQPGVGLFRQPGMARRLVTMSSEMLAAAFRVSVEDRMVPHGSLLGGRSGEVEDHEGSGFEPLAGAERRR